MLFVLVPDIQHQRTEKGIFFYTNEFQIVFQSCFMNDKQEEVKVKITTDIEAPPTPVGAGAGGVLESAVEGAVEGGIRAFLRRLNR